MFRSARVACFLIVVLALAGVPSTALADVRLQQAPDIITMRLGISPGDDHAGLTPGADRRVLERSLPELFETATALGIKIETVSVGRGFFAGDEGTDIETDLDLIVTGVRPNVLALGA